MSLTVNILGCGSASPSVLHMPSCQIIESGGTLYMIDCGEGAQLQMQRLGFSFARLRHIFISHLHGDHMLGLPGLLSSMGMYEVTGEVHVYMFPDGIRIVRDTLDVVAHGLPYTLVFHPLETGKHVILEDKNLTVSTFSLCHGVPAVGFLMRERTKSRKLRGDMAEFYNIPVYMRQSIKDGADFTTPEGRIIPNDWLTTDPDPAHSYAYCSDTVYNPGVIDAVKGVDLLYHEATYGDDRADKAPVRGHSTARQAGMVARQAGVGQLIIGHYSKSYLKNENLLLAQAQEEFANTVAAKEGLKVKSQKYV